jgi:hypothetical protein
MYNSIYSLNIRLKSLKTAATGSFETFSRLFLLRAGRSGDRISVGGEIFRTCPDRLRGQSSLLYNEYRVFPGGRIRPGRDSDPSPPSGPQTVLLYTEHTAFHGNIRFYNELITTLRTSIIIYPLPKLTANKPIRILHTKNGSKFMDVLLFVAYKLATQKT